MVLSGGCGGRRDDAPQSRLCPLSQYFWATAHRGERAAALCTPEEPTPCRRRHPRNRTSRRSPPRPAPVPAAAPRCPRGPHGRARRAGCATRAPHSGPKWRRPPTAGARHRADGRLKHDASGGCCAWRRGTQNGACGGETGEKRQDRLTPRAAGTEGVPSVAHAAAASATPSAN